MTRRIIPRIDAALGELAGVEPAGIYLTRPDYEELARAATKRWRQDTGSSAYVWPLSHRGVLIISAKLAPAGTRRSTIFGRNNEAVALPRRVGVRS